MYIHVFQNPTLFMIHNVAYNIAILFKSSKNNKSKRNVLKHELFKIFVISILKLNMNCVKDNGYDETLSLPSEFKIIK